VQYLYADGANVSLTDYTKTYPATGNSGPNALNASFGTINAVTSSTVQNGGNLILGTTATAKITPYKATVTQTTSITTAVTINSSVGIITTVSASTAAASAATFTVNNSQVAASSVVLVTLVAYSGTLGTNGFPVINVNSIGSGSFNIQIANVHASNSLSGTLQIGFMVLS
jgi:hypothetical protein